MIRHIRKSFCALPREAAAVRGTKVSFGLCNLDLLSCRLQALKLKTKVKKKIKKIVIKF